MADRVRGITIELNGDVTPLNKALSSTNKTIKDTQTQLKDVEKLLKLDPKNVVLLEQRQRLLAQAVEETRKKLDMLKDAEAQAQEQFRKGEISQEQYENLQREIADTENKLKSLEKAAAQSNATMAHIGAVAQEISDKTGEWAEKTRGLSAAAAGAVVALGGIALNAVRSADDLNTLSKQTGFSTDQLQEMSYAADLVDVSLDDITSAASRLKRNMSSTSKDVQSAFSQLGVSVRSANGQLRSSTDVFDEVIRALSQVENETERDTLAMQLLGKNADSLAGIIDDGGAALRQYSQDAQKMGLVLSKDTLNGLNAVNDRLDQLKGQMKGVLAQNGAKVIEAFLPLIEDVANWVGNLAEKLGSLDSEQVKTIATIAAVIAGVSPLLSLVSKISGAVAALMPVLSSLNAVMLANPAGAVAVGVAALAAGITALVVAAKNSKKDVEELTRAADGLGTAIDTANKAYETQAKDIETTYQKAQPYLKRLEELEKQGSLTADQQWEYAHAVEALNGLYPDLNLQIDENTGKLSDNIYNIEAQTKALRDQAIQQALQAKYTSILDAMADAQVEVYENQLKLRDAEAQLAEKRNAANQATMAYLTAEQEYNEALERGAYDLAIYRANMEEAQRQMVLANDAVSEAEGKVNDLNDAIKNGQDKVKEYADAYDAAVRGIASIMSGEGEKAGEAFMEGMARGIQRKTPVVETQAGSAARSVTGKAKQELRIASPSKVAEEIGRYWDEGLVLGLKKGQQDVEDTSQEVAETIIPQPMTTTNNTTTNHNVGGITVNVTAQPGQDVQAIAEAVMDEIQAAVEREGAAL